LIVNTLIIYIVRYNFIETIVVLHDDVLRVTVQKKKKKA
jgi:nucleosome binding factor SPN SPT16 subunit